MKISVILIRLKLKKYKNIPNNIFAINAEV